LTALPPPDVPFQTAAAPVKFDPDGVSLTVAPEVVGRTAALAARHDTDAAVLLLACWQVLLGRLSGQADLGVRYLADGRAQEELRGAMGPIAVSIPVRCRVEDVAFADFLRQVREAVSRASRWQDHWEPGGPGEPAVAFEFSTVPLRRSFAGVSFSLVRQVCHPGDFTLALSWVQGEGSARATILYDRRVLRREDVERIAGHFERLLGSVLADPGTATGALDILGPEERRRLLVDLNRTAADYPKSRCVHQLFEEQAARTPDRPAVVCGDEQLTYAELNARANRLAHLLRRLGVGRDAPVGLCVERSAGMIVGLLGILKAGGAYVPLHRDHPKARLAYQLEETGAAVVVTQEAVLGSLPEFAGRVLCLDRDRPLLEAEPATDPPPVNGPEDPVYVLYTSGSTGAPKGVAVRHGNLVNYTHFILGRLAADGEPGLHFASVTTLTADLGNTAIFPALLSGGCLHVIDYDTAMDGAAFRRRAAARPFDVLKITPSHLAALLGEGDEAAALPRRWLVLGGEAAPWALVRRVLAAGRCAVLNHYGPTETTVGSLTFAVGPDGAGDGRAATVPIGRPIANTQVYILDARGNPVPVGVAGELFIGGAGVARGYLRQPEQTAQRFVPDPFAGTPDAWLYRTGDRARYLPDGTVEFLGRADDQVKIRGFRVEPAEVEAALCRHPQVRQAAVVAREDRGDRRLVAYVVPADGLARPGAAGADELRGFLRQQLPDYMVPAAFQVCDALPLTPNGKIDRRRLTDLEYGPPPGEKPFVAPRDAVEETLAAIWQEVLGAERVGVDDDFFDLGGHSLLATQVISRILSRLEVQLPLRTIFETPTVAGLAATVARLRQEQQAEEIDQMLQELSQLSDEEVDRLLAAERGDR
jgi:amino acid adenylation domain-containing protein